MKIEFTGPLHSLADLTILNDQDGVLANWDGTFRSYTADLAGDLPAGYYDRPLFDLFVGVEPGLVDEVLARMNRAGFYRDMEPIPGAAGALNRMLELGIDARICTAPWLTNPTCTNDKLAWIEKHIGDGWAGRTILTRDKTVVRGHILIDDKPEVKGAMTPTFEHVYFSQRYNVGLTGHRRINAWSEWEDVILEPLRLAA